MLNDRRKTLLSAASWLFTLIERKREIPRNALTAPTTEGWRALQSRHQMPVSPPPAASAECLWRKGPSSRASDCQMILSPGNDTPGSGNITFARWPPSFHMRALTWDLLPLACPLPTRGEQLRPRSWKPTCSVPASPDTSLSWGVPTACFQTFSPFFFSFTSSHHIAPADLLALVSF